MIAIIAAIVIVAFGGLQRRAAVAALESDLKQAATQLGMDNVNGGSYPATESAANGGAGLRKSLDTTYQYTYSGSDNSYCLTAVSSRQGVPAYNISSGSTLPKEGVCAGHTGPAVGGALTVSTLAGDGSGAFRNGAGSQAQFYNPGGIVVGPSGIVYVGDANTHRVRAITSAGFVSTFAGSGFANSGDGTGTSASFNGPRGMAFDSAGNLFVADLSNHRIRRITTAGVVTTFAGSSAGFADGTGTAAQFNQPTDIAIDGSNNLYITDSFNNRIRKITPSGTVSTIAGNSSIFGAIDGEGTAARFNAPRGIAIDSNGNLYIGDSSHNRIRKVTPSGTVTTLAGDGTAGYVDGVGTGAQFNAPCGVAVDSAGNVYVADYSNNRVRKVTSSGTVTTIAGNGTAGYADGAAASAQFRNPIAIDVDSSGSIYLTDFNGHRIRKISE